MRIVLSIIAMGIATQITRFFPFVIFKRHNAPKWLLTGAKLIPGAVMITLVLTSLSLDFSATQTGLQWISAAAVVILHLLFKHPLISIFGGTALYMLLLQLTL
ncbi:MAG: AzlD domain-containing protein [Spirochaetales bacterium]|nr:AzlD domain-containing protein [Spirochaetales bacterium]